MNNVKRMPESAVHVLWPLQRWQPPPTCSSANVSDQSSAAIRGMTAKSRSVALHAFSLNVFITSSTLTYIGKG